MWYGWWIDSPLNSRQCTLLHAVFREVHSTVPRYAEYLTDFVAALSETLESGKPLHVALAVPGHCDLGWVTSFVHCPRCKAEGPFKRWQSSYPSAPIECPVCRFSYSPAASFSQVPDDWEDLVACQECHSVYRLRESSEDEQDVLRKRRHYRESIDELKWLRRVAAFYDMYPDLNGRIKPHFMVVNESKDPRVREQLSSGLPYSEIEIPQNEIPMPKNREWSAEELEVIDYLRGHWFSLPHRMQGVQEAIECFEENLMRRIVICPNCSGILELSEAS